MKMKLHKQSQFAHWRREILNPKLKILRNMKLYKQTKSGFALGYAATSQLRRDRSDFVSGLRRDKQSQSARNTMG